MRHFTIIGLATWLALVGLACGSEDLSEAGFDESLPQESEEPDFFGELTVDVSDTIVGTWKVQSYSLAGNEEEDAALGIGTESVLTFAADGAISGLSALPLFDYREYVEAGPGPYYCENTIAPADLVGRTGIMPAAWFEPDFNNTNGFIDGTISYELVETPFNPIIRFIVSGLRYTMCCDGYIYDDDPNSYGQCGDDFQPEYYEIEDRRGYLVIGARENELALLRDADDDFNGYVVILTRVTETETN